MNFNWKIHSNWEVRTLLNVRDPLRLVGIPETFWLFFRNFRGLAVFAAGIPEFTRIPLNSLELASRNRAISREFVILYCSIVFIIKFLATFCKTLLWFRHIFEKTPPNRLNSDQSDDLNRPY
jgi:hypothetical protein